VNETECILFALAHAVEQRDRQTAWHCERLAFISVALGMALRLPKPQLLALYRGGFLHDVGKVGIPDSILLKPAALSADEWVVMRSHPLRGEEICRPMKSLAPVLPIVRSHHERWDGSGYPDGLRGRQIPLLARVLQIADIYDALTSPRPYKPALPPRVALQTMQQETSRGWRDPSLMELFFRLHERVIARFADYQADVEPNPEQMNASLLNLQKHLTNEAASQWVPQVNSTEVELRIADGSPCPAE
jgi:putative two-component system response regulator